MSQPQLGERVTFAWKDVLRRDTDPRQEGKAPRRSWQKPEPGFWAGGTGTQEGIVYGLRTLSNGTVEEEYEYDGYYSRVRVGTRYYLDKAFLAVLIAYDVRRKPVVVALEDVQRVEVEQ